jgi:hypothetical protein
VIIASIIYSGKSCYAFENGGMILSNGSSLISYTIKSNKISETSNVINGIEWSYVTWPSYDERNKIIYFEAQNKDYGFNRIIFALNESLNSGKAKRIIEGQRPAISFDGSLLSFYRHPNQLWILNTKTIESRLLVSNFSKSQPAVWISDQHLLYSDIDYKLVKLDVFAGVTESTGHQFLIPGALSPDRKRVLCGSYDGKSISSYYISSNEVKKIKESNIYSMGSSFMWFQDSEQFLYTKQTFFSLIKLNESRSLFCFLSNGKDIKMIDKFALFGGIYLK